MTIEELRKKIELFEDFHEGSEFGELISNTVCAADSNLRYGNEKDAETILLIAESHLEYFYNNIFSQTCDYEDYRSFSNELHKYFLGREQLTEEEYDGFINGYTAS